MRHSQRVRRPIEFHTADLCDEHEAIVDVAEPMFHNYGGRRSFCGRS